MATTAHDPCRDNISDPTEPIFTLRGRDPSAAETVDFWAGVNAVHLGQNHPKILEARKVAEEMRQWPEKKKAD